jgi:hypothetical protein
MNFNSPDGIARVEVYWGDGEYRCRQYVGGVFVAEIKVFHVQARFEVVHLNNSVHTISGDFEKTKGYYAMVSFNPPSFFQFFRVSGPLTFTVGWYEPDEWALRELTLVGPWGPPREEGGSTYYEMGEPLYNASLAEIRKAHEVRIREWLKDRKCILRSRRNKGFVSVPIGYETVRDKFDDPKERFRALVKTSDMYLRNLDAALRHLEASRDS